ncbi:MAG TPA: hemolysin family protein, partial [Propionibacteriaceae bacterium]|nr:hemolysin family protein [Propionibacteriaceae bacterium]
MPLVEILIVLALVLLNGYFAMSELAVVSARPARLEALARKGSRRARLALALARDPGRMLSTVQIGITLVGIIAGAFGGATLAEPLDNALARLPGLAPVSAEIAYTLVVLAITYLSLIVGELVPKHLALRAPERIASLVAPVIDLLSRISTPPVWLLEKSSLFVLRLLGSEVQPRETVTEEEVRTLIAEGTRTGVFHKQEQEMIIRVLRLADRPVRAIMTPRVELVWLDVEDDPPEIARVIKESGHGRFVIGKGSLDEVLGIVHVRSLLDARLAGRTLDLRAAVRPALVVHDNMPVLRALEVLRQARVSMALVVDEYGEVEGVVTVEDVLEAVVGDMPERRLGEDPAIIRREDGSLLMDGLLPLDEVKLTLGFESLPDEKTYHTLAGFILAQFGGVPEEGQTVAYGGWRFEIVDMDGRRIDKVLVRHS